MVKSQPFQGGALAMEPLWTFSLPAWSLIQPGWLNPYIPEDGVSGSLFNCCSKTWTHRCYIAHSYSEKWEMDPRQCYVTGKVGKNYPCILKSKGFYNLWFSPECKVRQFLVWKVETIIKFNAGFPQMSSKPVEDAIFANTQKEEILRLMCSS